MLYDTLGILFVPSIDDKIYTICDECIEKLHISTEFKNCVLACKKNACWRGHCCARLGGGTAVTPDMKQELDSDMGIINKVSEEERNQVVKVEERGNKSDESWSECDEESNEESEMKSDETFNEAGVSLRKPSDIHEYKCNICNKAFKRKVTLENYVRTHEGSKRETFPEILSNKKYSCRYCNKMISRKQTLVIHERTHKVEKPYVYEKFDKPSHSKERLLHNAVHLKYKPITCNVCDKAFMAKKNLNRHMLMHTGIKSFQCSVCSKSFLRKDHYNSHIKVHTSDSPYKCDTCKKTFKYKQNLSNHISVAHLGLEFECDICTKTFKYRKSLRDHMSFVHLDLGFKFECNICKKTHKSKKCLRRHMSAVHLSFKLD